MRIEVENYFKNALVFNDRESEFRNSLLTKLPQVIIDIHSHIGREQDSVNLNPEILLSKASTYPYFDHEMHLLVRRQLWNEKIIKQVVFGFPFNGVDVVSANQYIQATCNKDYSFIPFLLGDPENANYTIGELRKGCWKGLKMYAYQLIPPALRITDFLPETILRETNDLSLPVILHLPNGLNQDLAELIFIAKVFPRTKFIVAHFGFLRNNDSEMVRTLEAIKGYGNIFFDTSVYDNETVLTCAFKTLGAERILYGSDQPFNLIRGKTVFHPTLGKRTMTDNLAYHWVNKEEQLKYRCDFGQDPAELPNMQLSSLNALVSAMEACFTQNEKLERVKKMVFFENATQLIKV